MNLEKLKVKVNPEYTALVIIDMQRDYCCEGGVLDKMGFDLQAPKLLASRLNEFVNRARKVQKFIVHIKMELNSYLRSPALAEHYERVGLQREYNPSYSEFYGVTPREGEVIIPKYRYSGFVSTYFDQYLRSNGIKTLILTGLATNVCVESTARDGFMRDYQIIIPEDMTEGTSLEAKKWSLFNINTFFGEVVNSNNLLSIWGIKD
ncbi:MAG: cysteine hydrolase [Candidatus Zixiibacteriota bacterium]